MRGTGRQNSAMRGVLSLDTAALLVRPRSSHSSNALKRSKTWAVWRFDVQQMRCEFLRQIPIVRHKQNRARVVHQRRFKSFS